MRWRGGCSPPRPWLLQCGGCGYVRSRSQPRPAAVAAPRRPPPHGPGQQRGAPRLSQPSGRGCSAPRCRGRPGEESRVGRACPPALARAPRCAGAAARALRHTPPPPPPPAPFPSSPPAWPLGARRGSCGTCPGLWGDREGGGAADRKAVRLPFSCIPAAGPHPWVTREGLGGVGGEGK